jgi:hypothetical protein
MRTQSIDTSPEAERFLIALLRQKGVARRFQLTASLSRSTMVGAPLALQHQHQTFSEQESLFVSIARSLGSSLTQELRQVAEQRQIFLAFSGIDLQAVLFSALNAFEQAGIVCALTGSLASCLYGMQQAQMHIDILANLEYVDATLLQELLPAAFYGRPADIQAALAEKTSMVYYHLPSLFRLRVGAPQAHLNEPAMLTRRRYLTVIEGEPALPVLAPEDISILALTAIQQEQARLRQRGRTEEPDDLWNELLGLLKVQGPELDLQSIEQQACALGLLDEMQRAFEDAGLHD